MNDSTLEIETSDSKRMKELVQVLIGPDLNKKLSIIAVKTSAPSRSAAVRNAIRIAYESLEAE